MTMIDQFFSNWRSRRRTRLNILLLLLLFNVTAWTSLLTVIWHHQPSLFHDFPARQISLQVMTRHNNRRPIQQFIPHRLLQLQEKNSNSQSTQPRIKILYIITSSSPTYNNGIKDRINEIMIPVIWDGVESLLEEFDVDVYLLLGYNLTNRHYNQLRQALPPSVGIEVWNDAFPMAYQCNSKDKCVGYADGKPLQRNVPRHEAMITIGGAQLARQHRFVIKDKFPYYDFFMAYEDDMRLTKHHVHHYLTTMKEIRRLQTLVAATETENTPSHNHHHHHHHPAQKDEFWGDLSMSQLRRMRPGFIRVEVYQPDNKRRTQPQASQLIISPTKTSNTTIDPTICCHTTHVGGTPQRPVADDLLMWESSIVGTSVRQMPESSIWDWVLLLPGPSLPFPYSVNSYWSGRAVNTSLHKLHMTVQQIGDPKFLAQPAGWMASRTDIMEYHQHLCASGFLPPYQGELFPLDGLHRHNVEFWSGGIQLWCKYCNIQRVLLVDSTSFAKQLLYHSANNKQYSKPTERLVRAVDYFGQVHTVINRAQQEKMRMLQPHHPTKA